MTPFRRLRAPALAALLLATGAAPPYPPLAFVEPLTRPPAPISPQAGSAFAPAPVPDSNLDGPPQSAPGPAHAELSPGIYMPHATKFQGDGFTPNSTVQGEQQRHYHPAPALNLSVPLQ
jgi:hypothetical protein